MVLLLQVLLDQILLLHVQLTLLHTCDSIIDDPLRCPRHNQRELHRWYLLPCTKHSIVENSHVQEILDLYHICLYGREHLPLQLYHGLWPLNIVVIVFKQCKPPRLLVKCSRLHQWDAYLLCRYVWVLKSNLMIVLPLKELLRVLPLFLLPLNRVAFDHHVSYKFDFSLLDHLLALCIIDVCDQLYVLTLVGQLAWQIPCQGTFACVLVQCSLGHGFLLLCNLVWIFGIFSPDLNVHRLGSYWEAQWGHISVLRLHPNECGFQLIKHRELAHARSVIKECRREALW